jgi:glycosyltransferase involved in cell wall biosynthesis
MSSRVRVVHFVDSEEFGGAEQAILTLLEGLDASRWHLSLAHRPSAALAPLVDGAHALDVETWTVPAMQPGAKGLGRIPRFASELRRRRPAIVHFHLTWPLACQYALLAAVIARVPTVVATVHLYVDVECSRRAMWQQRTLTHAVDRYLAVSQDVRRRLMSKLSWPGGKIEVVHNAVFSRPLVEVAPAGLRERIVGNATTPLVLVPARLTEQKGHRFLLRALVDVPDAHFALAGDGPERAALEAQARDLGVEARVSFLGYRNDVAALLSVCDLVVLPSLYEGLPVSLLEAMAARRPVIATRIGGTDELVTSGRTGLLVEPGNATALAVAIRSLLDDTAAARELAERASLLVERRFSAEAMCNRVGEIYEQLLET